MRTAWEGLHSYQNQEKKDVDFKVKLFVFSKDINWDLAVELTQCVCGMVKHAVSKWLQVVHRL